MKHSAGRASDPATTGASLAALLPSWQLALDAARKSPKTIRSYTGSVRALTRFLADQGLTNDVESTGATEVRAFLASKIERTSAASGTSSPAARPAWRQGMTVRPTTTCGSCRADPGKARFAVARG